MKTACTRSNADGEREGKGRRGRAGGRQRTTDRAPQRTQSKTKPANEHTPLRASAVLPQHHCASALRPLLAFGSLARSLPSPNDARAQGHTRTIAQRACGRKHASNATRRSGQRGLSRGGGPPNGPPPIRLPTVLPQAASLGLPPAVPAAAAPARESTGMPIRTSSVADAGSVTRSAPRAADAG